MRKTRNWTVAKLVIGLLLVALITLWTYHESTKNELVWDSYHYLVKNVYYISSLKVDNIIWMFLSLDPYWHPLTWLSWAVDFQTYGGLIPWGYHLSNNILHAINSVLVFVLALVVFGLNNPGSKRYPFRIDNHALIAAFFASLLFAVHPQHVESVVWVAQRKDLLCQLFLLLSMLTYVKYASSRGKSKVYWFNGTLGLFAMALLSKPMAVTFPVLLLLIDVYPLRRTKLIPPVTGPIRQYSLYKLLREKVSFFLLSLLVVLITLHLKQTWVASISLDLRMLNAFNSILLYLNKLILPLHFSPLYPYLVDAGGIITWKAFLPIFGVLALTLASLFAWTRKQHVWLIAWLFYLVALSPVLGLVQAGEQGAADRFTYLPTLPAYLLIGAGILAVLDKASTKRKNLVLLVAPLLVFLLSIKTMQQIPVWQNPHTLWSYIVKSNPNIVTAQYNLGITFLRQQNYEKAAYHFDQSVKLPSNPTSASLVYPSLAFRGLSYMYLGRYEEALKDYMKLDEALELSPDLRLDRNCIRFNSGWIYARFGMMDKAIEIFDKIEGNSQLKSDSITLLENFDQMTDNTSAIETLPNFCESVFVSSVRVNSNTQGRTGQ
jgi:tetratricopeptide (TPR) repeat protein